MIPMVFYNLIIIVTSMLILADAVAPAGPVPAEPVVYATSLRLRERLWRRRTRFITYGVALLLGACMEWLTAPALLFALASQAALLSQPLTVRVTTTGLTVNGERQLWSAFDHYTVEGRHLQLRGFVTCDLWLAPEQMQAVVAALPPRLAPASTLGRPLTLGEMLRRLVSLALNIE